MHVIEAMSFELPDVPAPHDRFIPYLTQHETANLRELVEPYNRYETKLREGFAQHRDHSAVQNPFVNAIPIFKGHEGHLKTRARDVKRDPESHKYIMPLKSEMRRENGAPATVESLEIFQQNFNLFSEQSLAEMDWSNVVAAGSSVVTAMLPVPEKHGGSRRALREYYHQQLAPSSDVDLFIWGLDEKHAIEKIAQIEKCVRDSILSETTTIRTKNAITIASQYPTRHVQIVLRLYKSISEILTGFDVDCSCFAYNGRQVYATPRGITSFLSQTNTIDLSRRSPSYETRLAKYAHRGFEVYYSALDRKRIDPTLYDRSFVRTWGLARLLVLERLPKESDREAYLNQRRQERGRPPLNTNFNPRGRLPGNIKDDNPEDVADWDLEADVSSYHTFTVPYGPKYHARKIERLLYVKDMLLNAEWNHKKDRKVHLHRHPCFIGDVASIIHDCCGECPRAKSDEEIKIAEEERKVYVHGTIEFMKDDPGRQAIGSFHPLTSDDWTDMAYLGNTQELCTAIIDGDLAAVETWVAQKGNDVNKRDHTGRTPLHLSIICGQFEIMKALVGAGARMVSRVADGFTSLHMASAVGRPDMIKFLAMKSEENEEEEALKDDARRLERRQTFDGAGSQIGEATDQGYKSDTEMIDAELDESNESDSDESMTQGSFVKVTNTSEESGNAVEEDIFGPDIFDANVVAWDSPVSPLHVAILSGHVDAIKELVNSFGVDVLLPVKLRGNFSNANDAILNLALASMISPDRSRSVVKALIDLGAKPSQGDANEVSAFHGATIIENVEALKIMFDSDKPSAHNALDFVTMAYHSYHTKPSNPVTTAVRSGNSQLVQMLLHAGAKANIPYEEFREAWLRRFYDNSIGGRNQDVNDSEIRDKYKSQCKQPIEDALGLDSPEISLLLLDSGADVNTIDTNGEMLLAGSTCGPYIVGRTVLDHVESHIENLKWKMKEPQKHKTPELKSDENYLEVYKPGSYEYVVIKGSVKLARDSAEDVHRNWLEEVDDYNSEAKRTDRERYESQMEEWKRFAETIEARGAKRFYDLHPKLKKEGHSIGSNDQSNNSNNKRDRDEMENPYWEPKIAFSDQRINERKSAALCKLFNAVMKGDIRTIKALTLQEIDDGQTEKLQPLNVATSDSCGFSPLSIAVIQGNVQLAQMILDIASIQYRPSNQDEKNAPKRRFRIRGEADDDADGDSDIEYSGESIAEIPVTSELVNETFTIEDLGLLKNTVGSSVKPSDYLTWRAPVWMLADGIETPHECGSACEFDIRNYKGQVGSHVNSWNEHKKIMDQFEILVNKHFRRQRMDLLWYSAEKGDMGMVRFLLKAAKSHARVETNSNTLKNRAGSWSNSTIDRLLHWSIRRGKTELTELLITEYGVALPLEDMLAEVEVPEEEREKPKYYQGLKVYGKHKKAWAAKAVGKHHFGARQWRSMLNAPFLRAVYLENRQSVEFWQSDACLRMYETFGDRHQQRHDVRLIARKFGGWRNVVTNWLGIRRDLALHCTIIRGRRTSQNLEEPGMTKYLLSSIASSLDKKSVQGYDPLWLAYYYRQPQNARILIEAGANQNTRDNIGMNLMHALLAQPFPRHESSRKEEMEAITTLIKLVDARMLPELFHDRCSAGPTGLTPLAYWIHLGQRDVELFRLLEQHMPADALSMFDGAGQTPLHSLIIRPGNDAGRAALLELILALHPHLLTFENGAGQTPYELSSTLYIHYQTSSALVPPWDLSERSNTIRRDDWKKVAWEIVRCAIDRQAEGAAAAAAAAASTAANGSGQQLKRKMISVRDASEVAKRLAERKRAGGQAAVGHSTYGKTSYADALVLDDNDNPHDEVELWHDPGRAMPGYWY